MRAQPLFQRLGGGGIHVEQPDRPHDGGGQRGGDRRSHPARASQKRPRAIDDAALAQRATHEADAVKHMCFGVQFWLWRKLGAGLHGKSCCAEQAGLEKVQLCAAIHLSLHQLQLRVLPLGLAI